MKNLAWGSDSKKNIEDFKRDMREVINSDTGDEIARNVIKILKEADNQNQRDLLNFAISEVVGYKGPDNIALFVKTLGEEIPSERVIALENAVQNILLYGYENKAHGRDPHFIFQTLNSLIHESYDLPWEDTVLKSVFEASVKHDDWTRTYAQALSKLIHSDQNPKREYWEYQLKVHKYSEDFEPSTPTV